MIPPRRLVSVVIPVHNGERYLGEAIASVQSQTYASVETIVVDDGSTDGTAGIARSAGRSVRYDRQSHAGAAAARNRGAELAQGDFIAFLDADDLWTEGKLERQVAAFESDPTLDLVLGHLEHFRSPDLEEAATAGLWCPPGAMPGYTPCTLLIRRCAFLEGAPFDLRWRVGEFIDWYLKAIEQGRRCLMLPDVVTRRRVHAGNLGLRSRSAYADYACIVKAALDRRRNGGAR